MVQRMLGHASAAMTLDVYADLFDDELDEVADRLEAMRAAVANQPASEGGTPSAGQLRTTGADLRDTASNDPAGEVTDPSDRPLVATNAENAADLLRTKRDPIRNSRSSKIIVTAVDQRKHSVETKGLEPSTPALQRRCSAS